MINGTSDRLGVIISYSEFTNTATIGITNGESDTFDEILTEVPCPISMGLQTTAPQPGSRCLVTFVNNALTQPLVNIIFNQSYKRFDYRRQNSAGYTLPQYMIGM